MSTKARILELAQTLAANQADATALDRYFDDVIFDLGAQLWLSAVTLQQTSRGTRTYYPPANVVGVHGLAVGSRWLSSMPLHALEAIDPGWRDRQGAPVAYTFEDETTDTFSLFPTPDTSGNALSFPTGRPLGIDYPDGALAVFHTETRTTLPDWLDMPIALKTLEMEFARESDHMDPDFAKLCGGVADMLLALVR